ncbi:unnamed protein product [Closterium sp. NIES-53]
MEFPTHLRQCAWQEVAQPRPPVAGDRGALPVNCGVRERILEAKCDQVLGARRSLQRAAGGADADVAPELRHRVAERPGGLEVYEEEAPRKSVKLAVADREMRGKAKEGEVEAGAAHQDDGEEDEEEEVDVEQALGDDQELVGGEEEEDNPFLSDNEDVEEVFHIDRPVH